MKNVRSWAAGKQDPKNPVTQILGTHFDSDSSQKYCYIQIISSEKTPFRGIIDIYLYAGIHLSGKGLSEEGPMVNIEY